MKTQRQFLYAAWLAVCALLLLSACRGPTPIAGRVAEITATGVASNTPLPATPTASHTPTAESTATSTRPAIDTVTPTDTATPTGTRPVDKTPQPSKTPVVMPTQEATRTISQIMQTELPVDGQQVKPELSKGSNVVPDGTPVWKNEKGEIVYMYDERSEQVMFTSVSPDGKLVWFTDTDMRHGWYDVSKVDAAKFQQLITAWTDVVRMYKPSVPNEQTPHNNNPNGERIGENMSIVVKLVNVKDWGKYYQNTGGDFGLPFRSDYDPQWLLQAGKKIPPGLAGVEYRHTHIGNYGNTGQQMKLALEVSQNGSVAIIIGTPNDGFYLPAYELADPNNMLEMALSTLAYHVSNPAIPNVQSMPRFIEEKNVGIQKIKPLL